MELCIGRAHTCPLGVLWYSAADSVVFLSSATDVSHTQHVLLEVTEFRDESIAIRMVAPTEVQITAFQAMWHSNPVAGTREPHTPPYHMPPNEETPHHIHAQLGDLNDQELRQLMRDLSQEIVQHESTAPPAIPLPGIGHALRAM